MGKVLQIPCGIDGVFGVEEGASGAVTATGGVVDSGMEGNRYVAQSHPRKASTQPKAPTNPV